MKKEIIALIGASGVDGQQKKERDVARRATSYCMEGCDFTY